MPISKRTRYEVLRRDNHTCRYCGGTAPDAKLTVDHVTPVALGGSDSPDNLVAACRDCNYGKASTSPDAALVEDVKQTDLKWSAAIARVAQVRSTERRKRQAYIKAFRSDWDARTHGYRGDSYPLAVNWETGVGRFYDLGVSIGDIKDCIRVATTSDRVHYSDAYRYFAGCAWRVVTQMQDAAKEVLTADEVESN